MKSQKKQIHKKNWDILIVLDACRFDVFEDLYDGYLDGNLKKVKSEGSFTVEWLKKTFDEHYDLTYISANPFVNSQGRDFGGWRATEHFSRIYDAWLHDWDEENDTVRPSSMKNLSLSISGRKIAHFVQPHCPYLTLDKGFNWDNVTGGFGSNSLRQKFSDALVRVLGRSRARSFVYFLKGEKPLEDFERNWVSEYGAIGIIRAYKANLIAALSAIKDIAKERNGKKIIVTADHGEAFGEEGYWGHISGIDIPVLRNVPWLEVY